MSMNNLFNRIRTRMGSLSSLRDIRLEDSAKERMRVALSAYTDLHSVEGVARPVQPKHSFLSLFSQTRGLYMGALMLVLVVVSGVQVSNASEKAIPGDVLYPFKVSVTEPATLLLSMSPVRKAELSAEFAARRIDEAGILASRNRLSDAQADELATRFDTHVNELAKETKTLESKGELSVSLAVRSGLSQKVNGRSDSRVAIETQETETSEARFSARVADKSQELATTRERLDTVLAVQDTRTEEISSIAVQSQRFFAALGLERATTSTSTATTTSATSTRALVPFLPLPGSNQ